MNDRKVIQNIVTGEISIDELQDKILQVFMGEIKFEIQRRTPVDRGFMRQAWSERVIGRTQIEYSNDLFYLPFHITGTGLYGPKHQMICAKGMSKRNPKLPHVMAWRPPGKTTGPMIFRRCTKGMRPNPFINEGIEAGIANGCEVVLTMFRGAGRVVE
jgi:hypothetical protein